jgi:epoxyqueuosine reductase
MHFPYNGVRMSDSTPQQAAETIKVLTRQVGFDLVGIARAEPSAYGNSYQVWIASGKQGAMSYLARGVEERTDITKKFPWSRSVVSVALAYWQDSEKQEAGCKEQKEDGQAVGKIARYAWGRDYHKVVEAKLKVLERKIRESFSDAHPNLQIRTYCDTGPILEREFAARAGLGWVGKNTLLIHPQHGSWFVLGEMVLSLELQPDDPLGNYCGTCRRCIEACPTDAITPYSVDATRCISYFTLEERGKIEQQWHSVMHDSGWVLGCDICQEVCPFNRQPLPTREGDFAARSPAPAVPLAEILRWEEQEWDMLTRGRALRRAKFEMWKRNAAIVKG